MTTLFHRGENTLPIYNYTQVKLGTTRKINALTSLLIGASLLLSLVALALPVLIRRLRRRSAHV
jgi:ABC-type spermidine/putrescine transport system permease subunit II